jgi:hypothetical protein
MIRFCIRFTCWFSRKFWDIHYYPVACGGDGYPSHFYEYTSGIAVRGSAFEQQHPSLSALHGPVHASGRRGGVYGDCVGSTAVKRRYAACLRIGIS